MQQEIGHRVSLVAARPNGTGGCKGPRGSSGAYVAKGAERVGLGADEGESKGMQKR